MSKKVSIRYLIDVAIGSREPGVINFNALYTVLQFIVDRLDIEDEEIEIDSSFCEAGTNNFDSKSNTFSEKLVDCHVYENSENTAVQNQSETQNDIVCAAGDQDSPRKCPDGTPKKKPKTIDIKQKVDLLFERFEKIENLSIWGADTEQSIECLRQNMHQIQDKLENVDRTLHDLGQKKSCREENITACRLKMDFDKMAIATESIRKEFEAFKNSFTENGKTYVPQIFPDNFVEPEEIERIDNEIIELKTSNCILTRRLDGFQEDMAKVGDISKMVKSETFEYEISSIKEQILDTSCEIKRSIEEVAGDLAEITVTKIDKDDVHELLAEKADYATVHSKVSVDYMEAENRRIDRQLAEISNCVVVNEEQLQSQIDALKELVGSENVNELLKEIQLKIYKEISRVAEDLKKLAEMKPEADAVVARLRDLTCLSCDQDVVMKRIEQNNLAKFRDAHASKSMNAAIAYEVAKFRENGKIGLFHDDDVLEYRHSGGGHTVVKRKDLVLKTRMRRAI